MGFWDTIPSGTTVTGMEIVLLGKGQTKWFLEFPANAPQPLTQEDFGNPVDESVYTKQDDPSCNGTLFSPVAPPGKVCIYYSNDGFSGYPVLGFPLEYDAFNRKGFRFIYERRPIFQSPQGEEATITWAYTAP